MTRTLNDLYALLERVAVHVGVPLDEPATTTTAAPKPPVETIRFPTGPITSRLPWGAHPSGIQWETIARWEPMFTDAVKQVGATYHPLLLACFAIIETGGQHYTTGRTIGTPEQVVRGRSDNRSIGILQIRADLHDPNQDWDSLEPDGNILLGAKLLKDWIAAEGSWEAALARRWHPGTDPSSGVDENAYVAAVRALIAEAKGQTTTTAAPARNPFPRPTIYTLSTDFARFALTHQEAQRILGNRFPNRNGVQPTHIVNHIQDGKTVGSLDWWANGPGVQASATVMAQMDGSILRVIPEQHGPWTNGDVCNPTPKSATLRALGGNPNIHCLTLEGEGIPGVHEVTYTIRQLDAICWQFADWMIRYDIPLAKVISHASINQCNRARCPGEANMLAVLDKLKQAGFK